MKGGAWETIGMEKGKVYSSAVDGNQSLSHTPGKIVQGLPSLGEFRVPGTSAYWIPS